VHFSQQSGEQGATSANPNALFPTLMQGVDFQGFDPGFEWSDISPRLGVSYVFDWEKRLLLRANYGHYVDALGSGIVSYNLPLTYVNVKYEWNDANNDNLVDAGELPNTACTDAIDFLNIDPCNTGAASSPFKIDPDLSAPTVDEFIVGAEYELARDFTVGTNLTMRQRDDIIWTPFYDAQQFAANGQVVPIYGSNVYSCNNTVSGSAPDGRAFSEPFCVLSNPADPRLGTARARVETNMPGYTQEYQGIELTATKRLSNKWMMRGFLSWNDWTNEFDGEPVTPGIYGVGGRVQVFARGQDGKVAALPQTTWRVPGWQPNTYDDPYIAAGPNGQVYASVPSRNQVLSANQNGEIQLRWGGKGTDTASLTLPSGVAVAPDGTVYVVDRGNNRVLQFKMPDLGQ
jgi:hypothetical protein